MNTGSDKLIVLVYFLRNQSFIGEMSELAEGAPLETVLGVHTSSQIRLSLHHPPKKEKLINT